MQSGRRATSGHGPRRGTDTPFLPLAAEGAQRAVGAGRFGRQGAPIGQDGTLGGEAASVPAVVLGGVERHVRPGRQHVERGRGAPGAPTLAVTWTLPASGRGNGSGRMASQIWRAVLRAPLEHWPGRRTARLFPPSRARRSPRPRREEVLSPIARSTLSPAGWPWVEETGEGIVDGVAEKEPLPRVKAALTLDRQAHDDHAQHVHRDHPCQHQRQSVTARRGRKEEPRAVISRGRERTAQHGTERGLRVEQCQSRPATPAMRMVPRRTGPGHRRSRVA